MGGRRGGGLSSRVARAQHGSYHQDGRRMILHGITRWAPDRIDLPRRTARADGRPVSPRTVNESTCLAADSLWLGCGRGACGWNGFVAQCRMCGRAEARRPARAVGGSKSQEPRLRDGSGWCHALTPSRCHLLGRGARLPPELAPLAARSPDLGGPVDGTRGRLLSGLHLPEVGGL